MNRGDDDHTVSQRRVRRLERFPVQQVDEVRYPARMTTDELKRLVNERLRHSVSEVPEAHRKKERVVEQTWDCRVNELEEEPRSPVMTVFLQRFGCLVCEPVCCEAVFQRDPAIDFKMALGDGRVV